jgi:hypothetical protein
VISQLLDGYIAIGNRAERGGFDVRSYTDAVEQELTTP